MFVRFWTLQVSALSEDAESKENNRCMPDLPRWLDDPHKKAGRVKDEGGQIEMEI